MNELEAIRARLAEKLPDDARMDAYYYGFSRTGVRHIDSVLSAVAIAGKGSHHTESWNDEDAAWYYANRPGLPSGESAVDLIQKTADIAARNHAEDIARLLAAIEAVEKLHKPVLEDGEPVGCEMCDWDATGGGEWPCYTLKAITAALTPTPDVTGGAGEAHEAGVAPVDAGAKQRPQKGAGGCA